MTTTARTLSEVERRTQLLNAAREVFDEKGCVAQETFYLYFGTKRDIIVALAQRPMELVADRLKLVADSSPSFEETIRGMVRTGFSVARDYPDLCHMIHMGSGAMEEAKATSTGQDMRALGIGMFEQAIASGDMESVDPEIAFDTFHSMLSGAMERAFADRTGARVDDIELGITQLIVRAFVKQS